MALFDRGLEGSRGAFAGRPVLSQQFWRVNRQAIQWAIVVALTVVAVAYFAMPVRAERNCPGVSELSDHCRVF